MTRSAEAFVSPKLFEDGIGYLAVARFKSNGDVEVGAFLLDVYCLGVKDVLYEHLTAAEYEHRLLERVFAVTGKTPIDLSSARKLVETAVAYAERLGIAPHADYRKARRVFGGINAAESIAHFAFGKDGKPFYIQGPHDTRLRRDQILKALETRCGPGNYNYLVVPEESEIPQAVRDQLDRPDEE